MSRIAFLAFYDQSALGVRIIGSYLRDLGHEVTLVFLKNMHFSSGAKLEDLTDGFQIVYNGSLLNFDYDVNPITEVELQLTIKTLQEFSPDIIGISARSLHDGLAEKIINQIKPNLPYATYVAGGYGPTLSHERWLNFVDIVIRGDGEEAMADVVYNLEHGIPTLNIANTAHKVNGGIVAQPLRRPERNISKYPHPMNASENTVFIDNNSFLSPNEAQPSEYYVIYGRGCTGKCSYCSGGNWKLMYDDSGCRMPSRRLRDIADVIAELKQAKEQCYSYVNITDEFLLAPIDKIRDFFEEYRKHIRLPFYANIHPQVVKKHPDILALTKDAGLALSSLGIQSADEEFNEKVYNRKQSNTNVLEYANALDALHIAKQYHFIRGNPVEPEDALEKDFELIRQLPFRPEMDFITVYFFMPFPSSAIVDAFGMEKLTGYDARKWFREGLLLFLRAVTTDTEFATARCLEDSDAIIDYLLELSAHKRVKGVPTGLAINYDTLVKQRAFNLYFKNKRVYVWGYGARYQSIKDGLDVQIAGIFDNNKDKHGTVVDGITIMPPEALQEMPALPILVSPAYYAEISKHIRSFSPKAIILDM